LLTPQSKGLAGKEYLDTFFGASLAAENFGRDRAGRRFDDLAVGPALTSRLTSSAGNWVPVEVIYGSGKGLTTKGSQIWRWDSRGIKGNPLIDQDSNGEMFAAADFGGGRAKPAYNDLAVGDSLFPSNSRTWGAVGVIPGSRSGLTRARPGRPSVSTWAYVD